MGAHFSSVALSGGSESGVPSVSYAYATGNPAYLGADATYSFDGPGFAGPVGEVTPYLVQTAAPTVTCSPLTVYASSGSLKCPVAGTALAPGLYTLSFSQYSSTSVTDDGAGNTVYTLYTQSGFDNTLTSAEGDYTFSIVEVSNLAISRFPPLTPRGNFHCHSDTNSGCINNHY